MKTHDSSWNDQSFPSTVQFSRTGHLQEFFQRFSPPSEIHNYPFDDTNLAECQTDAMMIADPASVLECSSTEFWPDDLVLVWWHACAVLWLQGNLPAFEIFRMSIIRTASVLQAGQLVIPASSASIIRYHHGSLNPKQVYHWFSGMTWSSIVDSSMITWFFPVVARQNSALAWIVAMSCQLS